MAAYLVDTNILVRLITNDVPELAQRAEAMITPLGDEMVELPLYVIAEVVYVLAYNASYQYSRDRINKSLFAIMNLPQFPVDRGLLGQTLNTFTHTGLDFVDCLLMCHSAQSVMNVLTFDKKLLQAMKRAK